MSTHPDTHERITRLQKDVEQIKEELEDQWHERRSTYEERVRKTLVNDKNATILFLEIDGERSMMTIERDLETRQTKILHVTLWRASSRLKKAGLIRKVDTESGSPIYAKKPWAVALDIDDYVKTKIVPEQEHD